MIKLLNDGMQNVNHSREYFWGLNQGRVGSRQIQDKAEIKENKIHIQDCSESMITKSSNINWNLKYSFYNAQGRRASSIFSAVSRSSQDARLSLPVKGNLIISSDYGEDRGSYIHRGIDFDGDKGDGIYSAAGGKVIYVGYTESGGNEIVIQHSDNLLTRYAHLDEINVKEDQFVKDGEKIGTMGNTGTVYSTNGGDGSHMHFEVIENGQRVDPNKYLNLNRAKYQEGDYGSTYGSSSAYGSNTSTYGSTGTSTYGGSGGGSGWYWHDIEGGTILYDEEGNRLYYTPDPSRKDPYAGDPYEVSSTYEGTSSGGVEKKLPDDPDLSDYDHKFEPLIFTTSLRDYIGDRVSDFIIDKLLGPVSKLAAAFGNNKISSGSTIAVNSRLIANNDNNTITGHYSITCTKVTANDAFDGLYTSTITESGTEVYSFVGYNDYGQLLFKHNNMNFTYSEIYAKFNPENFQR